MSSLVLLVTYKMRPSMREALVKKMTDTGILEKIRKEDGCISYDYFYDAADPDSLLLVEEWQSEEQQQKHLQTAHMGDFKKMKGDYVLDMSLRRIEAQ